MGQLLYYTVVRKTKEGTAMRGYFTANGFYGLVNDRYQLFASESEYYEAACETAD